MTAPTSGSGKAPSANLAVIFGLLALFCLGIIAGIPAVIFGNRTIREVDASGGQLDGRISGRFAEIIGWLTIIAYPIALIIAIITYASN